MNEYLRAFGNHGGKSPFGINLAGISYPDPTYRITRAVADVAVIEYVLDGEGYVSAEGKVHHVCRDTVYFLRLGARHEYYSDQKNPFSKIFINFTGPICNQLAISYGLGGKHFFDGAGLRGCFERIAEAIKSERTDTDVQAELEGIFVEILSRLSLSQNKYSEELLRLKSYLDSSLSRLVSASELSRVIFRSPDYCQKLFLRELGTTPYAYQLERKMQTARALLADTKLSVGEIAARLGYGDIHYFSNLFKRKCGISPLNYRKDKIKG